MKNSIHTLALIIAALLGTTCITNAQNSLTREKKSAHYPFFQINTSLQYNQDGLTFANQNPPSQLSFKYGYQNLAHLQKGIVKYARLDQAKLALSVVYLPSLTRSFVNQNTADSTMITQSNFNLAINHFEFKFKTKFDRTSFRIGYIGIPYGRSPKISSEYSLIPGLAGADFKFSKDLGIRADFPITESLDLSSSLTSGGLLSGPMMSLSLVDDGLLSYGIYAPNSYEYNGNWLWTTTLKSPNHMRKNFGVSIAMGNISTSHRNIRTDANVFRIAPFFVYKHKDHAVFTNQLSLGFTNYSFAKTKNITWISQYELLVRGWASIYVANHLRHTSDRGVPTTTNRTVAGLSIYPTALLTLRFNVAYKTNLQKLETSSNQLTSFFQVIYGFGRKL